MLILSDLDPLIHAIYSLKQEANLLRDYILPLLSYILPSVLGFIVAYYSLRHQEKVQAQKERIKEINDWILLADNAISTLASIKQHYYSELNGLDNPFHRTLSVISMAYDDTEKLSKDVSGLTFIAQSINIEVSKLEKWRQLSKINILIHNYNYIVSLWAKRNVLADPIFSKLIKDYGEKGLGYTKELSEEDIFESIDQDKFIKLVDLTEKLLKSTDDLMLELYDFLKKFPDIGLSCVDKRYIKDYGPILTYNIQEPTKNLLERVTTVNYKILAKLFGMTEEQVKREYSSPYE